jgi:prepilin-type N-terminal cleavage/methylation domain-containing protein
MRRGFTLVEILVVLAILGILMAALSFGLSSARRQGLLTQAAAHGGEVSMALNAFLIRNIDLDLDTWTASLPAGDLAGAPPGLVGLSGFDCKGAATLTRSGMTPGGQSWAAAPDAVGCLIERVGNRFLVHTWVRDLPKHFVNGRPN